MLGRILRSHQVVRRVLTAALIVFLCVAYGTMVFASMGT